MMGNIIWLISTKVWKDSSYPQSERLGTNVSLVHLPTYINPLQGRSGAQSQFCTIKRFCRFGQCRSVFFTIVSRASPQAQDFMVVLAQTGDLWVHDKKRVCFTTVFTWLSQMYASTRLIDFTHIRHRLKRNQRSLINERRGVSKSGAIPYLRERLAKTGAKDWQSEDQLA